MFKHLLHSFVLLAPLMVGQIAKADDDIESLDFESVENEMPADALAFTPENPLSPYALKKNGKARKKFKIPYSALVDYYNFASQGIIFENPKQDPLLDLDLKLIGDRSPTDVKFYVDMKKKKVFPLELINPHSISNLFLVDPIAYTSRVGAADFLEAKMANYKDVAFNSKKLRYERNLIHLEDWRSLNHPPVNDLGADLTVWDKYYQPIDYSKNESVFYGVDFHKSIDELSNSELTFGNKVEFLANSHSFDRKLKEVQDAKKSVLIAVMSFFCDKTSKRLEDLLISKVKEGVDVKIMVEKVWTRAVMKKCMNRMIKGGVDAVYSSDFRETNLKDNLFHNKFMVIDSERVITGGSNIVEGDNVSTGFNHLNRDNDVYLEGPIASDLTLTFAQHFKKFRRERNEQNIAQNPTTKPIEFYEQIALAQKAADKAKGSRGQAVYEQKLSDVAARNNGVCRFVTQGPDNDKNMLTKVFIEHITRAKQKLNMTTGSILFSLPTDDEKEQARVTWNKKLFENVFDATKRGVKLDIIGNGIDGGYGELSSMINLANHKNRFRFKPITKTLVSILTSWLDKGAAKKNAPYMKYLQSQPNTRAWQNFQYMHSKLIQIDRTINIVSSYNLEEWSGDKSYESAVICLDENLSQEMDKSFVRDFVNSVPAVRD